MKLEVCNKWNSRLPYSTLCLDDNGNLRVVMTLPLNRAPVDERETFRKVGWSTARYKRHLVGAVKHFVGNEGQGVKKE